MMENCRLSCGNCDGSKTPSGQQQPPPQEREAWELEDLEQPYPDSAVVDVDARQLAALADASLADGKVLIVWFYAPWCKQCKLARPGFEAAAQVAADRRPSLVFAKLDCVKHPDAKKAYGVSSYPAFKAMRGSRRHRWIEVPRQRTEKRLTQAFEEELSAAGPVVWVTSEAQLRAALFDQVPKDAHEMDSIGQGEALAVAVLSSREAEAATAIGHLAANCSVRSSPLPFVATTDESLLPALGLPSVPRGSLAVVKLFAEPAGAPEEEQVVPRLVSTPIPAARSDGLPEEAEEEVVVAEEEEAALCTWSLGSRLPLLIDFEESPLWAKRAASLGFVSMHALLFLSPPHEDLAGAVRAAAARFATGQVLVLKFMVRGMEVGQNAMYKRYGVNSALDTPRLVFLDQRIALEGDSASRQKVYKAAAITEEGVHNFLLAESLRPRDEAAPLLGGGSGSGKDEL